MLYLILFGITIEVMLMSTKITSLDSQSILLLLWLIAVTIVSHVQKHWKDNEK